ERQVDEPETARMAQDTRVPLGGEDVLPHQIRRDAPGHRRRVVAVGPGIPGEPALRLHTHESKVARGPLQSRLPGGAVRYVIRNIEIGCADLCDLHRHSVLIATSSPSPRVTERPPERPAPCATHTGRGTSAGDRTVDGRSPANAGGRARSRSDVI